MAYRNTVFLASKVLVGFSLHYKASMILKKIILHLSLLVPRRSLTECNCEEIVAMATIVAVWCLNFTSFLSYKGLLGTQIFNYIFTQIIFLGGQRQMLPPFLQMVKHELVRNEKISRGLWGHLEQLPWLSFFRQHHPSKNDNCWWPCPPMLLMIQ